MSYLDRTERSPVSNRYFNCANDKHLRRFWASHFRHALSSIRQFSNHRGTGVAESGKLVCDPIARTGLASRSCDAFGPAITALDWEQSGPAADS